MCVHKTVIKMASFSASLWQADTVFGHLCWSIVRRQGEKALTDFLRLYEEGSPPILISDGFPEGLFPRPIIPPASTSALTKLERLRNIREVKRSAGISWLMLNEFNTVRRGESAVPSSEAADLHPFPALHIMPKNQIDRRTDTAGGSGGVLFEIEEFIVPNVTLYWRIEEEWLDTVNAFLEDLKASGYGKRKSVGYGQIASYSPLEEFAGFEDVPGANGFVAISRFVPRTTDPVRGFWNTTIKYGKLGEDLATKGNAFKCPLVQIECGSCFYDTPPKEWYGQLLSRLSVYEEVRHYAFAFALPIMLSDQ